MTTRRLATTVSVLAGCGVFVLVFAGRARSDDPAKKDETPAKVTPARAAFDRIKSLAGEWNSKSTKGWTEKESYQVIAGGSVVMHLSYGAHPGEWMATMFHMDGEHLMLTHYCIARNQPRLRATEISDDGSKITFTFHDATNLPSRDKGHMDKHVMMLDGPDRMKTRWTWYQDGKESWMEEIEHRRAETGSAAASK
jgi:hypothetical protein